MHLDYATIPIGGLQAERPDSTNGCIETATVLSPMSGVADILRESAATHS